MTRTGLALKKTASWFSLVQFFPFSLPVWCCGSSAGNEHILEIAPKEGEKKLPEHFSDSSVCFDRNCNIFGKEASCTCSAFGSALFVFPCRTCNWGRRAAQHMLSRLRQGEKCNKNTKYIGWLSERGQKHEKLLAQPLTSSVCRTSNTSCSIFKPMAQPTTQCNAATTDRSWLLCAPAWAHPPCEGEEPPYLYIYHETNSWNIYLQIAQINQCQSRCTAQQVKRRQCSSTTLTEKNL